MNRIETLEFGGSRVQDRPRARRHDDAKEVDVKWLKYYPADTKK